MVDLVETIHVWGNEANVRLTVTINNSGILYELSNGDWVASATVTYSRQKLISDMIGPRLPAPREE